MRSQYHSAYSPLVANAGTEYTPQWMKIPNFASRHHCGVGRLSMDCQSGVKRCALAADAAHSRTSIANLRIVTPSLEMEHFGHVRPPLLRRRGGPFLLHGLHESPPALRGRIRGHGAHVRCEIATDVLEVREQDAVAQVDGIVA